jgi:transposase
MREVTIMTLAVPDGFAAAVGIDWADRKHDLCLQAAGSARREYLVLAHTPEAIDDWAVGLRRRFENRPVAVCLEQRKGALINALMKYEHLVLFPVNPQLLAGLRRAFASSGAKDDPSDAALALDILLQHPERVPAWVPEDPCTRHLQALVQGRRRLVEERVRTTNRLLANLKGYYPQAIECFEEIGTEVACAFLTTWPSPGEASRARETTLTTFFHRHGVRGEALVAKRVKLLKEGVALTRDAGVLLPSILTTRILAEQVRTLLAGIKAYESSIKRVFKTHPDAALFASLPGAGPTFAPRLLAALGTQRERFPSVGSLQMYLGIAPVTERSGKSLWVHWRWSCPTFLRQSIVEWAGMSRRYSVWAEAFYREQRERGKTHNAATRALAFKWLRIVYRCWQDRRPYDEATYLKALQRRGSPLLKRIAEVPATAA